MTTALTVNETATVADAVAYHRGRSWHFWELVDDELERGALEEASSNVWYAAVHAVKAAAENRGWPHDSNALLEEAVDRLVHEEGAPMHIWGQYMMATAYQQRFFGGRPDADGIGIGKEIIAEFINTLESLR